MSPETREKLINSLKDIHGFAGIEFPGYLNYILVTILALGAIYFIYRLISKRKKALKPFYEDLLDKLSKLKLINDNKSFYLSYLELSKTYFNERLKLGLVDKTTEEIKGILAKIEELKIEDSRFIIESFYRADLAKFALKEFSLEKRNEDLARMILIIQELEKKHQEKIKLEKESSR